MPSNPLTQEEINEYTINRILNPSGYTGLSPYMPQGYFLSTPSSGDGPALWRLFDASFISSGIISPDRLGSGSVGLGNLYLADDGTWKAISIPATPTLHQVTTAGNVTTNPITVGGLNVNVSGVDRVKLGTGLIEIYDSGNTRRFFAGTSGPNGQLLIDSGGSWDVNFLGGGFKYLRTGNFGIGTTTDAGYKLDVNGSFRIQTGGANYLLVDTSSGYISTFNPVGDSYYRLGPSSNAAAIWFHNERIRFGDGGSSTNYKPIIAGAGSVFGNVSIAGGGNPLGLNTNEKINFSDRVQMGMVGTQYFRIGYVNADLGAKTIITIHGGGNVGIGTTTPTAPLHVATSVTASAALAQGVYFNNTLVAAANNDVLVGLDINPTFTLGGLTGVSRVGARIQNGALLIGTTLLNTDTISFPLQINGSSQNIGSVFRNALSTGYTSFRFYNDQNVNTRAMEMGYAGSAYPSAIVTGGVTGESAYLTSTGAYPLQLGTNNTARFIIFSNGNVAINTATDAGYKLDVNGTVRLGGDTLVKGSSTASNAVGFEVQNSAASVAFQVYNDGQARFLNNVRYYANIIANDYVARNNTMSFDINGYGAQFIGSRTAASAIARGVYFNNTLVAAANNDVLVGLDINPTFTNGAFTGVSNIALRVQNGDIALNTGGIKGYNSASALPFGIINPATNLPIGAYFSVFGNTWSGTQRGGVEFVFDTRNSGTGGFNVLSYNGSSWTSLMRVFTTGNVGIGTSITDAGYKLDVNGTARVSGNLTVDTNTLFVDAANDRVGIGTVTPTETLHLYGNVNGNIYQRIENVSTGGSAFAAIYVRNSVGGGVFQVTGVNNTIPTVLPNQLRLRSDSTISNGIGIFTGTSSAIYFGVNDSINMQIFGSTGNIGINATTDAGYKLDVNGTGRFVSTTAAAAITATGASGLASAVGISGSAYQYGIFGTSTSNTGAGVYGTVGATGGVGVYGHSLTFVNGVGVFGYGTNAGGGIALKGQNGKYVLYLTHNQASETGSAILYAESTYSLNNSPVAVFSTASTTADIIRGIGNSTTVFTVKSSGNVLIGTTTDAGYKLDVNGTFRSNNSVYLATASGSVGIGTTTPNYILDVYQTNVKAQIRSTGENQNATLFLGTPFGGTSSPKVAIIARAKTSWSRADLAFCLSDNQSSNSVEATISDLRMVILSDGKVGVNVANPTYQFQVSGDIALSGNLVPTAGSQTLGTFTNRFGDVWAGGLIVGTTFYGDNLQSASGNLYFKEGGGVERMRMTSSGNFLIGSTTDTGEKLQVNGSVKAVLANATTANVVYYDSATGLMTYGAAPSGGGSISLTTTGTSGVATLVSGTLNIPNYSVSFTNNTAGNIMTGSGTTNTLDGQTNLTWLSNTLTLGPNSDNNTTYTITTRNQMIISANTNAANDAFFTFLTLQSGYSSNLSAVAIVGSSTNNYITFRTMATDRMRIFQSGNVAINTTTDNGYNFEVNGSIAATAYNINGVTGYTGLFTIPTNPPGQQNIDIQSGIIVNIF